MKKTLSLVRTATGIALVDESEFQVQLYPNPFTSNFNLKVSNPNDILRIAIVDMMGRQVELNERSPALNSISLGTSLKPGMYVEEVYGVNFMKSFKVVKNE